MDSSSSEASHEKGAGYRFIKRLFDIVLSIGVISVCMIPGLVLCVAIALDTKGSPIYTQERMGRDGRSFRILKFRTMVADSDDVEKYFDAEQLAVWHQEHKVENDPRIVPLGRWLRVHSVDETPNFLNVLAGQMSVVGPRAIVEEELERFAPEQRELLLSVRPGITGLWQVCARNDATFASGKRQRLELKYVEDADISLDIKILGKTFAVMVKGTGR